MVTGQPDSVAGGGDAGAGCGRLMGPFSCARMTLLPAVSGCGQLAGPGGRNHSLIPGHRPVVVHRRLETLRVSSIFGAAMILAVARRPWVPSAQPYDPIPLAVPPRQSDSTSITGSLGMVLMPVASEVGAVLLAVTSQGRPIMAAVALLVLAASIAVGVVMLGGARTGERGRTREQRERYLDHLEIVRAEIRCAASDQRRCAAQRHAGAGPARGPRAVDGTALALQGG